MACAVLVAMFCAVPARASSVDAVAKATVLEPLVLLNTAPLSFGNIAAGIIAGTSVVAPNGTSSNSGGVIGLGGDIGAATFLVAVKGSKTIRIGTPKKIITLTNAANGATMGLSAFTDSKKTIRSDPQGDVYEYSVGGTLGVAANQAEGSYVGEFDVTFDYN